MFFVGSLSDPEVLCTQKFYGMSFCQGKFHQRFISSGNLCKQIMKCPTYFITSHIYIHTFFGSGTNYGDLGMCSSTFAWTIVVTFKSNPRFRDNARCFRDPPRKRRRRFQRQVLASKSAWSHCRCDEEHHVASPLGRWGAGKSASWWPFWDGGQIKIGDESDAF